MIAQEPTQHRPFRVLNEAGQANIVITCDHASKTIPAEFHNLGLAPADAERHIAWDIGAAGVAEIMSQRFDAPAVICGTSRLVIDCNRHPHDPAAMPEISDGIVVPGNQSLTAAARQDRQKRFFEPYHDRISEMIDAKIAAGLRPLILSIHSMTPSMNGLFRPWQISFSSNAERRATDLMLQILRRNTSITVGDNQPYSLDPAEDYSTPRHALARGLPYLQVEFRQDEVGNQKGVLDWAACFGDALEQMLSSTSIAG